MEKVDYFFNMENSPIIEEKNRTGNSGVWWHKENPGPLKNLPYIKQFGSMRFSKVNIDENMRPHLNDGIEIHYVNSGKYEWSVEGNRIELLPENLSVTAPWHKNGSPAGKMDIGKINWIVIKPEKYAIDESLSLGPWTKLPKKIQLNLGEMIGDETNAVLEKAKKFKHYFETLTEELSAQKEGYEIVVRNIIENLLVDLHRNLTDKKQQTNFEDTFIDNLTQIITDDINNKWLIEDLAYRFGMGKTKFTYEVKRLTGYPPNSFIINLKIEKAIGLITENELSMSDIALICGFSSLQHFTATFSQRIGISPGRYNQKKSIENQEH